MNEDPFQFVNQAPEDEEWTAHIKLLNQWTPEDRWLRTIIQYARSGPFYPADMHVDLIEQLMNRSATFDVHKIRKQIHMKMLEKSNSAIKLGEMTAIPLGFAVTIALEEITYREAIVRDSERNHIMSVMRSLGIKFDGKAVMRLHREWEASAKAESLRKAQEGNHEW